MKSRPVDGPRLYLDRLCELGLIQLSRRGCQKKIKLSRALPRLKGMPKVLKVSLSEPWATKPRITTTVRFCGVVVIGKLLGSSWGWIYECYLFEMVTLKIWNK